MERSKKYLLSILPFISLYGCDISPSNDDLLTSGGVVNKGILSQAIAKVYKVGTKELVKSVYTQIDGTFALDDINFNGTLYVEVTTTSQTLATCDSASGCGNYNGGLKQAGEFDENLNGRIDFGDKYFFHDTSFKLTAFIKPNDDSDTGQFAVTPLTHLAAEKINQLGDLSPDKITVVNAQVAELFGLNGTDITRVIPPDITNEEAVNNAGPAQQLYAALNAAVASAATSTNTSVSNILNTLVTSFKEDGGLVGNSSDPNKVTLASLQTLARDVAKAVETKYPDIDLMDVTDQIDDEIQEQLAKPADEVVVPSNNPDLESDFDQDGLSDDDEISIHNTLPGNPDTDGDGMLDGFEVEFGLNPLLADQNGNGVIDGLEDIDGDGLLNYQESYLHTNPNSVDTDGNGTSDGNEDFDGDGLNNKDEFNNFSTDPLHHDTDGDGINDGNEVLQYGSNPLSYDSDGDGMPDGWEVANNTNLISPDDDGDSDGDSLINIHEYLLGTNPNVANTGDQAAGGDLDSDGITNIDELMYGLNPFFNDANLDNDGDSISNIDEINNFSDLSVPNPVIEFVSDAQVYTNSSTGELDFSISADHQTIITSGGVGATGDLNIISGISDINGVEDVLFHNFDSASDTADLPIRKESDVNTLPNGNSKFIGISADNIQTVFSSNATDIITSDGNASEDLFVFNRGLQDSIRMQRNGIEPTGGVTDYGVISSNNQYVLMSSTASNLVANGTATYSDVYINNLHDGGANNITLVSRDHASGGPANNDSYAASISADGNRMVFISRATNLIDASETGTLLDVYLYDVPSNSYFRVSKHKNEAQDDVGADAAWAKISANGKGLVYQTPRDILDLNTGGAGAGFNQIFYVDVDQLVLGKSVDEYTTLVSKSYDASNFGYSGDHADGANLEITADGEYVIYRSPALNILGNGYNAASIEDIYMWNSSSSETHRLSQFVYGTQADGALNYDDNPASNHINGMGVADFTLSQDGRAIYALLNYGQEFTDSPAACSGLVYCLYRIKIPIKYSDSDNDGLNDTQEMALSTNLNLSDTDEDGLTDFYEVMTSKTSPINSNSDGDALTDGQEVNIGTDPLDPVSN